MKSNNMQTSICGFSLLEVMISLLLFSTVLSGFLAVNKQSLHLLQQAQQSFAEQTQQAECYEQAVNALAPSCQTK